MAYESGCRNSSTFDQDLYDNWIRNSTFNTTIHLELYVCSYTKFLTFRRRMQYADGCCDILSSIFGFISAVLTLITLRSDKYFKSISYFYFRLISIFEIFLMFHLLSLGMIRVATDYYFKLYAWFWFNTVIGSNTANFFPSCVDILTIYLSIERATACLAPTKFKYINKKYVAYGICMFSVVISALFYIPMCFARTVTVDPTTGVYSAAASEFGKSQFYEGFEYLIDIFSMVIGVGTIITSVFVIMGMVKSWKAK